MIQRNGDMKAGEDKWLGLSDWLRSSDKKTLTKEEVLDYIRKNEIQIEEVNYEQKPTTIFEAIIKQYGTEFFHAFDITEQNENGQFDTDIVDIEAAVNMYNKYNDAPISFAEYDGKADHQKLIDFGYKIAHEAYDELNAPSSVRSIDSTRLEYTTRNLENKKEIVLTSPSVKPWHADDDIHFGEAGEGRAVAWVRFGETTDSKGNRVLVIDEIQSNRHQEGRKKGYASDNSLSDEEWKGRLDEKLKESHEFNSEMRKKYNISDAFPVDDVYFNEEERAISKRLANEIGTLYSQRPKEGTVPDASFEKNWAELCLKRMLRYAVENGYVKVAWTTGKQ